MNVYDVITERIIDKLEQGTIPWRIPWTPETMPRSLQSGKDYRGVNVFLLRASGYVSPYWITDKQARIRGGTVKVTKREGCPIVFWNWVKKEDEDSGKIKIPILRYYTVFNAQDQCDGLDVPEVAGRKYDHEPIDAADRIVDRMPSRPVIVHREQRAYYRADEDLVNMPERASFERCEAYYSTLFHELIHSTGHESRLARKTSPDEWSRFGSGAYSREELVAECGAAFLAGEASLEQTMDNSAAYIVSWVRALRGDSKLVVIAAAQAQKAADFILDRKWNGGAE